MDDRFALVLDAYQLQDWQVAAELLREIVHFPMVTAHQHARKPHGFLAVDLPAATAQRLGEASFQRGIGVHVVAQRDVIPALKPLRVHHVRMADDALYVRASDLDAEIPLCWGAIRLLAATTTVRKETFHHWPAVERKTPTRRFEVTAYRENSVEVYADIYALHRNGQVTGARLMSRELNYRDALNDLRPDALTDADARMDSFRMLLAEIIHRAPRVHVPTESWDPDCETPTRPVATGDSAPAEFDAFNRWLLQRLRIDESPWSETSAKR